MVAVTENSSAAVVQKTPFLLMCLGLPHSMVAGF